MRSLNTEPPDRGDIVWIDFNPQMGREQAGRRPALVISPRRYNAQVGLALVCPITRQQKGYPFEVSLPEDDEVQGVVLADHIKSLDWKRRFAEPAGHTSRDVVQEVLEKLKTLLQEE
jgi:mRNA interferase MazF